MDERKSVETNICFPWLHVRVIPNGLEMNDNDDNAAKKARHFFFQPLPFSYQNPFIIRYEHKAKQAACAELFGNIFN